jgi:selenide,water dikinase
LAGYIAQGCVPGGTARNFESYGDKVTAMTEKQRVVLCDPQTSGGLVSVDPAGRELFLEVTRRRGWELKPIGRIPDREHHTRITVLHRDGHSPS